MKKLSLLFAVLMAWMGFSTYAAVGDVITDGTFYFNIVAEGDVNEVEFAPKPSGTYTVTNRSIFGSYNTVTISGVTYNVVGIGEGAFRNARFPSANITNLPTNLRYISDYAFQGVKSGTKDDSDSNIRFYGNIETVSPLAFIDNEIVGTINVSNGTDHYKQVASTASRIQYNSNTCYTPCKDGNTLVAVGGMGKVLGNGSGGYKCANKLTLASEYTIVGPHAMHGNQAYTQLDLGNVVEIQEYAFKNSAVEQLTLPATLTTVDPTAFEGASAIFSITCNATTPPAGCVFEDVVYATIAANGHITVPEGSLAAYQADPNWGRFWPAAKYAITIADGIQNGTVTADKAEAEEGEAVTLTVTPAEGYQLATLTYTVEGEAPVAIENNTFNMPAAPVTINATFEEAAPTPTTYTITIADGIQNGTVVADKAEAEEGETVTLTITPAEGYQLEDISVSAEGIDELIVVDEDNQFEMPAANVTVSATFSLIPPPAQYYIICNPEENGNVEANPYVATIGETITLTVTPDEGYELDILTVTAGYDYEYENEDPETEPEEAPRPRRESVIEFVSQGEIQLTKVDDSTYTFVIPEVLPDGTGYTEATEFRVRATFAEIPPVVVESAINFSATVDHATIEVTVAGEPIESGAAVAEGTPVTITVTPENGYKVASLTVETEESAEPEGPAGMPRRADVNVTPGDNNTYTFDMPAAPVNINVTMEQEVTTGVADLNVSSNKGVKYVNVMGQVSDRPFNGVNIVIDGDKTYKVIK